MATHCREVSVVPNIGRGDSGTERSTETGRANLFCHLCARERGGAAGGAKFLFCQFAGGVEAIALSIEVRPALSIEVDRPLPS